MIYYIFKSWMESVQKKEGGGMDMHVSLNRTSFPLLRYISRDAPRLGMFGEVLLNAGCTAALQEYKSPGYYANKSVIRREKYMY